MIMEQSTKKERHKRAFIIWLAIYPVITVLYLLLGEKLQAFPVPVRTLILTLITVPILFYFFIPVLNKIFKNWLRG